MASDDKNNDEEQQSKQRECLLLAVRDIEPGSVVWFKLSKTTKLRKLMKAYCDRIGILEMYAIFCFNGNIIHGHKTPNHLEMKDKDEINVMIESRINWNGRWMNVSKISIYPFIKQMKDTTLRLMVIINNDNNYDKEEIAMKISNDEYDLCPLTKLINDIPLQFNIATIHSYLLKKDVNKSFKLSLDISVFITTVLEYLCIELILQSGIETDKLIEPKHMKLAIFNDHELLPLFLDRMHQFYVDSKLHENNMDMKLKEIVQNIGNYFRDKNHDSFKPLKSKINDMESVNDDNDKNICNALGETGIYLFIFDYLDFVELKNNVYKTCKLFHVLSLRILNRKYFDHVCNGYFVKMITEVLHEMYPDMKLREDAVVIMSGLLISVLNDFVDKIKEKMGNKRYEEQECLALLGDVVSDLLTGNIARNALEEAMLSHIHLIHGVAKYKNKMLQIEDNDKREDGTDNMDKSRKRALCEDEEHEKCESNEPPLKRRRIDETRKQIENNGLYHEND